MGRARFTQKDIERALRAAKETGVDVEIVIEGSTIRILSRGSGSVEETAEEGLERWKRERASRPPT